MRRAFDFTIGKGAPTLDLIPWQRMIQDNLFPDSHALRSRVILRRKDFETLFDGFTRLRAVSYVVSPDLLLEFLEKRGYESLEVVVGENLADTYRQALAQKGAEAVERLAGLIAGGRLKIFIPDRVLHTKLYILERPGQFRVIQTSANLTETARAASRQVNYAWWADLLPGHPWLAQVEKDHAAHRERCELFLGDLAELLQGSPEDKRRELVETWLRGVPAEEVDREASRIMQELSRRAMESSGSLERSEPIFTQKLPEAPAARRQAERLLASLGVQASGSEAAIPVPNIFRYVQESHGLPLLRVDMERKEVRLGMDGQIRSLTEPLPEPPAVAAALEHLEAYVGTVDFGQASDPTFAKVSIFEALLYVLSAPFSHEYMRLKRRCYAPIDKRGPSFLYIYGPSQNGKSTFARFALKLLAGRNMDPVNGGDFGKRRVQGAAAVGTAFPLIFDDLVLANRYPVFEEVLKNYWETWWTEDHVVPQIILSSNAYTLRDWAKSRVKRLDFDVQFSPGGPGKEALARIFKADNPLFKWFSGLYLRRLSEAKSLSDDELELARRVFEDLYRHAGRSLPGFFPARPIEQLYDTGRKAWRDLLYREKKARLEQDHDRASVHFTDDMQHYELKEYENLLPAGVKHRRRGKTLIVETPKEFLAWLEGGSSSQGLWGRFKRWVA